MKDENLTPEQSFTLITKVIEQAKAKFEENGFIYVFWGALIALTALGQFVLYQYEYYEISYYPYFLLPIGSIYTGIYYSRKKTGKMNLIGMIVAVTWIVLSINLLILGFFFFGSLQENLIPVLLILVSVGIIVAGSSIRSILVVISGILINLSAFVCFKLEWIYQPLLMGIVSIITIFIPGLILLTRYNKKQRNV
jgi:hypothetical protein